MSRLRCALVVVVAGSLPVACNASAPTEVPDARVTTDADASVGPTPKRRPSVSGSPIERLFRRFAATSLDDERERHELADAVRRLGDPAVRFFVERLRVEGDEEAAPAIDLLVLLGPPAVLPAVEAFDRHPESRRRVLAVLDLLMWACRDPDVAATIAPVLVRHLDDPAFEDSDAASVLPRLGPAVADSVPDLVRRWLGEPTHGSRVGLRALLVLGTDAAEAAPHALAMLSASTTTPDRRQQAAELVLSIGDAHPACRDQIQGLLRHPIPEFRQVGLALLPLLGDPSPDLIQTLIELIRADDPAVGPVALRVLLARPDAGDAFADQILDAAEASGDLGSIGLYAGVRPAYRAAFQRLLARVPPERRALHDWTTEMFLPPPSTPEAALLSDSAFQRRLGLLRLDEGAFPEAAMPLLDDPDEGVRACALDRAVQASAVSSDRVRTVAGSLITSDDLGVRCSAIEALARQFVEGSDLPEELRAALRDGPPRVRLAAATGLSTSTLPLFGDYRAEVEALAAEFERRTDGTPGDLALGRTLIRLPGGVDALLRVADVRLRRLATSGVGAIRGLFDAIRSTGSRARALETTLRTTRWTNSLQAELARELLADLSGDPVEIALRGRFHESTVRRLLTLGEAGHAALPVFVGHGEGGIHRAELVAWCVAPTQLVSVLEAAARAGRSGASDDPLDASRRRGAAFLAGALTPSPAFGVLHSLASDPDVDVRTAVLTAATEIETSEPGAAPDSLVAALVAALVERSAETDTWSLTALARSFGSRAAALEPELRARLDRTSDLGDRCELALALQIVAGDEAPLRDIVLAELTRVPREGTPRFDVGDEYLEAARWRAADVAVLTRAFWRWESEHARCAFLPAARQLGPSAAPLVLGLVELLRDIDTDWHRDMGTYHPSEPGGDVLRALAAIGPAARAALPEIRHWMGLTGDPDGAGRAALEAIERGD